MLKLIDIHTKYVFITFEKGQLPHITHPIIEESMRLDGIMLPYSLQDSYGGKYTIKLDDPDFERAFREIYYEHNMDHSIFQWIHE